MIIQRNNLLISLIICLIVGIVLIGTFIPESGIDIWNSSSDDNINQIDTNNNYNNTEIEHTLTIPISNSNTHTQNETSTVNTPKTEIIITGTGGDVLNNSYIKNNIPNNEITNHIVELAKEGTPMVTFGEGNPKVMISAGIHGAELPAQIAAIKMINYLSHTPAKGTVYIVPFMSPSSTAQNTRLWNGKNLNSIAQINGTPSNQLVKKAKEQKVDVFGDFHSTQPGAVPGRDSVLCTISPTYGSYETAEYISHNTGFKLISEYQAGESYPGAVEDVSNLAGTPTVTCEVLSPHGTVKTKTILKSYIQMLTLLIYNHNLKCMLC